MDSSLNLEVVRRMVSSILVHEGTKLSSSTLRKRNGSPKLTSVSDYQM